jgi:hypothetical protein
MFRNVEVLPAGYRAKNRPSSNDKRTYPQHVLAEMTELARVLCVAMVEPSFRNALLENPVQAIQSHPHHHFELTEDEQNLLNQPGPYSLQTLAEYIERARHS